MKSCPVCNRTFDDTLTFCLNDGSLLSPPFESEATVLQMPDTTGVEQETVVRSARKDEQETTLGSGKQRSRWPLILAGVCGGAFLLLVLIGGIGYFGLKYYQTNSLEGRDTPSGAVRAMGDAIRRMDVAGLKRTFSRRQLAIFEEDAKGENLSLDAYLKEKLDSKAADWAIQDVRNEKINGNEATVEVKMQDEWDTWQMQKEDGEWKYVPSGGH